MNKIRRIMGMLLISVCLLGILGGCGIIDEFRSEKDLVDYNATYGVSDGEYTLTLNNSMLEAKAIDDGAGNVYMDVNTANQYYNSRIYWEEDENCVLYATPEGMAQYTPDSTSYIVGTKTTTSDIHVVINRNGMLYISLDFVKENTKMDSAVFTEPNRVVTRTEWGEAYMTTVTGKKAVIRYQGGIKSPVFRDLERGERLYVLDDGAGDEWAQVVTEDGYNGWVRNEDLDTPSMAALTEPEFTEPVFTGISKNYKINLAWHGVYSESANEELEQILTEVPISKFAATFIGHYNIMPMEDFQKLTGKQADAKDVAFRPEIVEISTQPIEKEGYLTMKGRVFVSLPHGNVLRYAVLCGDKQVDVDVLFKKATLIENNTDVYLSFKEDDCIFL